MGSASSREREDAQRQQAQRLAQQRNSQTPPSYQPFPAPPPGYQQQTGPYYPPPAYLNNQQPAPYPYGAAPSPQAAPYGPGVRYPAPPTTQLPQQQPAAPGQFGQRVVAPTQEYQTTATIRNQVNLKKQTLKLESTPNPQILAITFRFDASAPCRVTTFTVAREDTKRNCLITAQLQPGPAVKFDKGLDLKFPPEDAAVAAAHTLNLARVNVRDLTHPPPDGFPIVVRLEALTDEGRAEGRSMDGLEAGCSLPNWVQSQTTYAKVVKEDDGSWGVRVLKQKIWVKGTAYELQEIYGMEQNKTQGQGDGDGFEDVDGNDCVICMSAPRDTTALPCRHMCMCHGCASALKAQTNKCPICRNEIESLLHIKMRAAS